MRSPSVDRLIWSKAAARDLLPFDVSSAHAINFVSYARNCASSETGPLPIGGANGLSYVTMDLSPVNARWLGNGYATR
jgi:hypothetical protein